MLGDIQSNSVGNAEEKMIVEPVDESGSVSRWHGRLTETLIEGLDSFRCALGFALCPIRKRPARGPGEPVFVVFRYDDYSAKGEYTDLEKRLIEEFARRKISCTFGVIPHVCAGDPNDDSPQANLPLSGDKAQLLRAAVNQGVVELALHGCTHQALKAAAGARKAEFRGLAREEQLTKIRKGQDLLQELCRHPVFTFIPPWNAYDLNTVDVLEECGFTCLSANRGGSGVASSSLSFLPATCELSNLRLTLKSTLKSPDPRPTIVVTFHAYDFSELKGRLAFDEFLHLVDWVTAQPMVQTTTLGALTASGDSSADHYLAVESVEMWSKLLPSRLMRAVGLNAKTFYPSPTRIQAARKALVGIMLISALSMVAFLMISIYLGLKLILLTGSIGSWLSILLCIVLFVAIALIWSLGRRYWVQHNSVASATGAIIGLLGAIMKNRVPNRSQPAERARVDLD